MFSLFILISFFFVASNCFKTHTVPGGIFTCAGEFEQCPKHGECVLIRTDCELCAKNGDPSPFGKYLCPDRKTCVADFATCPDLKNTFWDWTLPPRKRAELLVDQLSLEEQSQQLMSAAPSVPRLNIPYYQWWTEGDHGLRVPRSTGFPQGCSYGASWSVERIQAMGEIETLEARATHRYWMQRGDRGKKFVGLNFYAPSINLVRDPRGGRNQEVYSEDPMLNGRMAQAVLKSIQKKVTRTDGTGEFFSAIGCCKVLAIYNVENNPESRFTWDAVVGSRDMWETYLPHFEMCVGADKNEPEWVEPAGQVMCAYNKVNGVTACGNEQLLNGLLRDQWKYEGFVISDFDAWAYIFSIQKVCPNMTCAAAMGLNAGCDQEGVAGRPYAVEELPNAVRQGMTTKEKVRTAAIRLFEARMGLGMFDPPSVVPLASVPYSVVSCDQHLREALRAAEETIVLYRNTPVSGSTEAFLPFTRAKARRLRALRGERMDKAIKVALIGPAIAGGYYLQANYAGHAAWGPISILEGIHRFACDLNKGVLDGQQVAGVDFRDYYAPNTASDTNVSVAAATLSECIAQCHDDLSCNYYTYDAEARRCWFLRDSYLQKKVGPSVTSGSRSGLAIMYPTVMYADVAVDKPTLGSPVDDARACSQLCLADPGCTHFSWIPNKCYLRPSLIDKPVYNSASISGASPKKCHSEDGQPIDPITYVFACEDSLHCDRPQKDAAGNLFTEAIAAAKAADVTIVAGGLDNSIEEEDIDRKSFNLPDNQYAMFDLIAKAMSPHNSLVALFVHGGAFRLPETTRPKMPAGPGTFAAVLDAWYPGQMGGIAVGNIIGGHANPGAKSAVSWYKSENDLPANLGSESFYPNASIVNAHGYSYRFFKPDAAPGDRFDIDFGYGLSYTTFQYKNPGPTKISVAPCQPITVNVTVSNTGKVTGDEVVQLYLWPISGDSMKYPHPILRLGAFKRVYALAPGESRTVTLKVNPLFTTTVTDTNEPAGKPDIYHTTRMVFGGDYILSVGPSQPSTQPTFDNAKGFTVVFTITSTDNYDKCKKK